MGYRNVHEDQEVTGVFVIYAFNDVVGIACNVEDARTCVRDLALDFGKRADASYDTGATVSQVKHHRYCMGCGKEVQP